MILIKIEVKDTKSKGLGVFSSNKVLKGTKVWHFDPQIDREFSKDQYDNMSELGKDFLSTYGYVDDQGNWYLDVGNERFINHSDDPNIKFGEDPKSDGFTVRDIQIGEELTINYREIDSECRLNLGFENKE